MSATLPIDPSRRLWMTTASVAGGAGLVASAVPFVASLAPSERARALGAPIEVGLQGMRPGELKVVEWRGKPVFVLRRSQDQLASLERHDDLLADPRSRRSEQPDYASNTARSARPEFVVLEAVCTHLGCIPAFRPTPGSPDAGISRHRGLVARRLLLPVPRIEIRPSRPGLQERSGADEPQRPSVPIHLRLHAAHRRRFEGLRSTS